MIEAQVIADPKELNRLLEQLPAAMQAAAYEKGLRPAANVVKARVKELTPRSSQTGSTNKWSQSTKAKRAGELPLWKTVRTKVWRKGRGPALALVGYQWPKGNKGHFVIQSKNKTRRQKLWGNEASPASRQKVDVLKRSLIESQDAAANAFVKSVRKEVVKQVELLAIRRRLSA